MIRDAHKQETHDAIIDAAERLLDRYGYSKMTMTDLAEEAGIGVGTTYLYFPGKVDVALAVLKRFNDRVRGQINEIAQSERPPSDKLRRMLLARIMIRYQAARTRQHQIDDFKRAVQSVLDERRAGWMEAETALFASVLVEGRAAGEFHFDDPQAAAEILMCATSCLTPKHLGPQDFNEPDETEKRADRLIALLVRGLQSNDGV